MDRRVAQHRLVVLDRGVVRGDLRGQLRDRGRLRVEGLTRHEIALDQRLRPREIALGVLEIGAVLLLLGLGAVESRLIGAGIDLDQKVAFVDDLTLMEVDRHDLAVDARPHQDGVVGLDRPETGEDHREIAGARIDRTHGDGRNLLRRRSDLLLRHDSLDQAPDGGRDLPPVEQNAGHDARSPQKDEAQGTPAPFRLGHRISSWSRRDARF